jgi:hypothetical protein
MSKNHAMFIPGVQGVLDVQNNEDVILMNDIARNAMIHFTGKSFTRKLARGCPSNHPALSRLSKKFQEISKRHQDPHRKGVLRKLLTFNIAHTIRNNTYQCRQNLSSRIMECKIRRM